MRVEVVGSRAAAADLKSYAELRLLSVFGHLQRHIQRLMVCFPQEAAGDGKRCRMLAELTSEQQIRTEEKGSDYFAAVDRAAGRLDLEVAQALRVVPPAGPITPEQRKP
jgi:ribosome-associated translation inhibitor RaiA